MWGWAVCGALVCMCGWAVCAVSLWFTGDFYGFADGLMASRGGAVRWCAAGCVGGWRFSWARPRAGPSHCALRWRQSSCVVGTLRPPAGAPRRGGDPCVRRFGGGSRLVGSVYARGALRCLLAVAACGRRGSVPLAASSPNGTRPVWRCPAASLLLWSFFVRLDTASPARLAAPADAARDSEPTPRMVRSDPRTLRARRRVVLSAWRPRPRTSRCPGPGPAPCRGPGASGVRVRRRGRAVRSRRRMPRSRSCPGPGVVCRACCTRG